MRPLASTALTLSISLLSSLSAWAVGDPPAVSRAEFEQMMQDLSNWGRWGDDDELGTLNLITPEKRAAAAGLVRHGISVSMELELNKTKDALNPNPFEHKTSTTKVGIHEVASDRYAVDYHGYAHSHMDGLPHFAHNGFFYNGVPFSAVKPDGAQRLGIQNAGVRGVFSRGVLVDVPRWLGINAMEPGHALTPNDLRAWEKHAGVTISSGDVLLIRTGRWAKLAQDGNWNFMEKAAGSHATVARFLKERDVAAIGCDGISDVLPSGVEGVPSPLHTLVLAALGMPIFDNLDLEAVAAQAAELNRSTFLFVAAPLRVRGGTGSPLNPLAVF